MVVTQAPMQQLELVKEAKVFDILAGRRLDSRLEASGVLAKDGLFYVIFDNLPHIALIGPELSPVAAANDVIKQKKGHHGGFEDIAYDARQGHFYVLIESLARGHGTFMAKVQEYDASFGYLGQAWLDFPLDRPNKGLEGLTCVHRGEQTYLLGLCEGNRCRGGKEGEVPGGGRVHVFQRGDRHWERVGKIRLPETVLFEDYSGIAVAGDRIAVISQMTSALWLGSLAPVGLAGDRPRHVLRAAEGRRRRDRLRDGRRRVVDGTGPAGHGLGQGQAGAGPPVPGQGPIHPHLPRPQPWPLNMRKRLRRVHSGRCSGCTWLRRP